MLDKRGGRSFSLSFIFENLKVLVKFNLNPVISVKGEGMVCKDRTCSIPYNF
jgi:hypothetical protein